MHRAGLRVSEALALTPKDVDLDRGAIRVLRGKRGRSRTVGIDASGAGPLAAWLAARERLGFDGRGPVFCSAGGRALTSAQVRRRFKALGTRAQIAKRVHPHGLHHNQAGPGRPDQARARNVVLWPPACFHPRVGETIRNPDLPRLLMQAHLLAGTWVEGRRRITWVCGGQIARTRPVKRKTLRLGVDSPRPFTRNAAF